MVIDHELLREMVTKDIVGLYICMIIAPGESFDVCFVFFKKVLFESTESK